MIHIKNGSKIQQNQIQQNSKTMKILEIGKVPFKFYSTRKQNFQISQPGTFFLMLKVRKFQNESMKSSLLPKYEPKIVKILFIFWEKQ